MESTKRTKLETIEYFKQLAYEFELDEIEAIRNNDLVAQAKAQAKAEAYELSAFELERNML